MIYICIILLKEKLCFSVGNTIHNYVGSKIIKPTVGNNMHAMHTKDAHLHCKNCPPAPACLDHATPIDKKGQVSHEVCMLMNLGLLLFLQKQNITMVVAF